MAAALPTRIAVVLAALAIVAVTCLTGDHGAARAAVGQATGPLIGSTQAGAAILAAHDLAPGDVRTGEITVTNVGDVAGDFALGSTGALGAPLAQELDLLVFDLTAGRAVYSGSLASLTSVGLGSMAQGESHRYRFTVSLPWGVDDSFQGAASAVTFTWSATAPDVAPPTTTAPGTPSGPARAPVGTAESPPKATTAGATVHLGATLSVRSRQHAKDGKVAATITCQAGCHVTLSATAKVAGAKQTKVKAAKRTLRKAGRARMRLALPAQARLALEDGRTVVVRLKLKAVFPTRTVTSSRTVRVRAAAPAR